MNLRPYVDEDFENIVAVFTASVHEVAASHYDEAQREAWAPRLPDVDAWRERLARLQTAVAEVDSRIAGFVSFKWDGHIVLLYVSPDYLRRGVASGLYGIAERALVERGVNELFTDASLVARPFFERQGFAVVEEQLVTRRGVEFRRFAMRKRISYGPEIE